MNDSNQGYEDHAKEEHAIGDSANAVSAKTASAFEERPPMTDSDSVTAKVTRFRAPFETSAERYAKAWPKQCNAALKIYAEDIANLGAPFGLKTDSDIVNHVHSAYAAKESFTERLRAMSEEPIDEERMKLTAEVFSNIAYYRNSHIGFSRLACILFQLPKFLALGHHWGCVFPTQEMQQIKNASVEDLKQRPPVFVATMAESSDFCVSVLGDRRAFRKQDMGPEIAARLRDLEQLRIRDDISIALASEGYSEELRAGYHSFALLFWDWHEAEQQTRTPSGKRFAALPSGKVFDIPSSNILTGARRALSSSTPWIREPKDFPYYDDKVGFRYSLGGITGDGKFNPLTDGGFHADITKLDPETSLMLTLAFAAWTEAFKEHRLDEDLSVTLHINDFLDLRGLERKKRDYTKKQKQDALNKLRAAAGLFVQGRQEVPGGKSRIITGEIINIGSDETEDLFSQVPYTITIRPGLGARQVFLNKTAPAKFYTRLAQLRINKPGIQEKAYRIGHYLVEQYRTRSATKNFDQPFFISTILEGAAIDIPSNSSHYDRFMETILDAFEKLVEIGVAREWKFKDDDAEKLPERGRFNRLLKKEQASRLITCVIW